MKILCAWMMLGICCVASAGEVQSVLVKEAPVLATNCCNKCDDGCCTVYNEKVEDRKTCRKTLRGKVIRREVKRTVLTPVR